jgi:hypothetical protein
MSNILKGGKPCERELRHFGNVVYGELKAAVGGFLAENMGTYSPLGIGNVNDKPNFPIRSPREQRKISDRKFVHIIPAQPAVKTEKITTLKVGLFTGTSI